MDVWKKCFNHWGKIDFSISTDCKNCPHERDNMKSCEEKREMERARYEHYVRQREMTEWNAS